MHHSGGMPQTTTLLGSADVCVELGDERPIDRSTLSRWVSAGRITPAMRLPGKNGAMLFDPKDVQRLKEALAVTKGRAA